MDASISTPTSGPRVLAAGVAGVLLVGVIDWITGYEVRIFPLYFLPITYVAWGLSRSAAASISLLSAVTWVVANWATGRQYTHDWIWAFNFTSQLIAFTTVGLLVAELQRRLGVERELARKDSLTQLPNRRAFLDHARLLLAIARRSGRPVTLAYVDLDNFKQVNDARGHEEGDRVLVSAARALRERLRSTDIVARIGGDEFAVILPDTSGAEARIALERVRADVGSRMRAGGWAVTSSIGGVSFRDAPASAEEALAVADAVMYRTKREGKDRVLVEEAGPAAEEPPARAAS